MSIKTVSLGSCGSAVAGILITGGTNATPIVATITAGHGLKDGDRIAIKGVTTLTNMNGIWELGSVTATTAVLKGSVGNGAYGGTAVVGVVLDKSPFLRNHTARLDFGDTALVATVFIEAYANYDDFALATPLNINGALAPVDDITWTSTVAASAICSSSKAFTAGTVQPTEVRLSPIMKMRCSAYTSGVVRCTLSA